MAVPKHKVSRSKRNMRRSHDRAKVFATNECSNCGEMKLPHHICQACGHYAGRAVIIKNSSVDDDDDVAA